MLTKRDPTAEVADRPFNNLLRRLNAADFALLAPHLDAGRVPKPNDLLYSPGDDVETVHFPCGPALVSYLVPNEDGRDVETILIGREGAVGGIVSQGFLPAYTRIMVKFGGPFARLPVSKLDAAKIKSVSLAQYLCALCRLHAGAGLSVHRLQRHPLDRAAHGQMDHLGNGAHRRRQQRAADPRTALHPAGRRPLLYQPRDPDLQGRGRAGDPPRRRFWCETPMRCASGHASATKRSKTTSKRCCGGSIRTRTRTIERSSVPENGLTKPQTNHCFLAFSEYIAPQRVRCARSFGRASFLGRQAPSNSKVLERDPENWGPGFPARSRHLARPEEEP